MITLLYLAVQMRQTTTSTNAAAYQGWLAVDDSIFASFDDQEFCQAINQGCLDFRNLTEENFLQFIAWARRYWATQQSLYELYCNGRNRYSGALRADVPVEQRAGFYKTEYHKD